MTPTALELRVCVDDFLPHLTEKWTAEFVYDNSAQITRTRDGLTLSLWLAGERVEVSGRCPPFEGNKLTGLRDWMDYKATAPSCTFALDRKPPAAAKVIERMAAEFEPVRADVLARMAKQTAHSDTLAATLEKMAAVTGARLRDDDRQRGKGATFYVPKEFGIGDYSTQVEVTYGASVKLTMTLSPETAEAVLLFMKNLH